MSKIIWASGSSIVFLVRVDCAKINPKDLRCFRDYIGGNNKHIVRLAEKDVQIGEKKYKYFAMQGRSCPNNIVGVYTNMYFCKS